MAVGTYVWVGTNVSCLPGDADYCDTRTLAEGQELCEQRIKECALTGFVATSVLLILKGHMRDR